HIVENVDLDFLGHGQSPGGFLISAAMGQETGRRFTEYTKRPGTIYYALRRGLILTWERSDPGGNRKSPTIKAREAGDGSPVHCDLRKRGGRRVSRFLPHLTGMPHAKRDERRGVANIREAIGLYVESLVE